MGKDMASAHRRHQDSLERFLNFSSSPPLTEEVRDQAETRFRTIVDHFRGHDHSNDEYDRTALVRYTYEYALTEKAKDNLLQAFFVSLAIPLSDTVDVDLNDKETEDEVWSNLVGFADYLLNNFFLPCFYQTNPSAIPGVSLGNTKHTYGGPVIRGNASSTIITPRYMPYTGSPPMCHLTQL